MTQDRMPAIPAEKMTEAQKQAAAELASGPRGAVFGPFIPLLRSPALMRRAQKLGEQLRFHSALPAKLNEMAILLVSREWTQQFEWHIHRPLALKAGLAPEIVEAIAQGRRPSGMADDEEIVHDFCVELYRNKSVSDPIYRRAVDRFGEQGVIDLIGVNGYYTLLAMVMNVARTPPPEGAEEPLQRFPR